MKTKLFISILLFYLGQWSAVYGQTTITLHGDQGTQIIPKEIYGQFAEHLGSCIYGGLWVGENSDIPNTNGYRTDVLNALKALKVPVAVLPMSITGWMASDLKKIALRW